MARRHLPSFTELFARYAPKFAEVEMIPGGFYNAENRNRFYLEPDRLGKPLHFGYSGCEGGPPGWPFIDVARAGLRISFNFEGPGVSDARTPHETLRKAAYRAIQEQLFPGRVFRLKAVELKPDYRPFDWPPPELPLEIAVEGDPIPGWVGVSSMWAKLSEFFDQSSPEYQALCAAARCEYVAYVAIRHARASVPTTEEMEEALRAALAALPT